MHMHLCVHICQFSDTYSKMEVLDQCVNTEEHHKHFSYETILKDVVYEVAEQLAQSLTLLCLETAL